MNEWIKIDVKYFKHVINLSCAMCQLQWKVEDWILTYYTRNESEIQFCLKNMLLN